jgi:hypothetical protein
VPYITFTGNITDYEGFKGYGVPLSSNSKFFEDTIFSLCSLARCSVINLQRLTTIKTKVGMDNKAPFGSCYHTTGFSASFTGGHIIFQSDARVNDWSNSYSIQQYVIDKHVLLSNSFSEVVFEKITHSIFSKGLGKQQFKFTLFQQATNNTSAQARFSQIVNSINWNASKEKQDARIKVNQIKDAEQCQLDVQRFCVLEDGMGELCLRKKSPTVLSCDHKRFAECFASVSAAVDTHALVWCAASSNTYFKRSNMVFRSNCVGIEKLII